MNSGRRLMCAASGFKTFELSVSKKPSNLGYCSFHVGCLRPRTKFTETHCPKLCFYDSELLVCLSQSKLDEARHLLEQMPHRSNSSPIVCWTSLLSKYARGGFVDQARALFDILPERNVVTYNAMLSGYVQYGRLDDAYRLFEVMPERNVVSWTSLLCGLMNAGRVDDAMELFKVMPERNMVSWNSLIVGLIRNEDLEEARQVFDVMPAKNQVSWNAMISGYSENCRMEEARALFDKMPDRNVVTWTSLIAGYCRIGDVEDGYCLFQRMPERNVISWTAMIGGFAWNGLYREALLLFLGMREQVDIKPNGETFISLAYACTGMGLSQLGKQLHAHVIITGWDYAELDGRLSKGLIHMYSVLGNMDYAYNIFIRSAANFTVQCCNSMINGYVRIGQLKNAQILFETAPVRDKISWTSLINGYFNVGKVEEACDLFRRMPDKDDIAWTAMISGHVQNELFAEATCLFAEMRTRGVPPLNSTYSVLLGAAGALAYLDQGKQLHCQLTKTQTELDLFLENSLVSMYAKCGEIDDAYAVFSNMGSRDLVSWNSMIMGFSHHGLAREALELFEAMKESRIRPNSVTFLGVLSACNHAGLVSKGCELFSAMNEYSIQPGLEHYISMVNLLGRAGKLEEAEEFVLRLLPSELGHALWGALLGVCGFGEKNAEIAKRAAMQLLELDPLNAPALVALCNVYAATGQHVEVQKLRKEMGLKGVKKVPGCSLILLEGKVHVFLSGERSSYPLSDEIVSLLFGVLGESKLLRDENFGVLSSV